MAVRVIDPFAQFLLDDGRVNAGGSITTYLTDLTTLAPTYNGPDLVTTNGSTVTLDAYGRPTVDMWSAVMMGVVVKDALGATIKTRNNVPGEEGEDQSLPTDGDPDDFLMWDGTEWIPAPIIQVPDPTGLSNYQLVSDGTGIPVWQQIPEAEETEFPVVIDGNSFDLSGVDTEDDAATIRVKTGTASGSATGGRELSVNVTFASAFSSTPTVFVQLANASALATYANQPSPRVSSKSTTGFTVVWVMGETDDDRSQFDFSSAPTFDWVAIGPVAS